MVEQKEYYKIVVKNNETATVYKIDYDEYNEYQYNFYYVYHTKNGEKYPLEKIWVLGIDELVVDDAHLNELLKDLFDQCFCDEINLDFVGDYDGYYKAF